MALDSTRLAMLADSYIDHVLLILKAGDGGANLRDFLDPWWSLKRGAPFVRKTQRGFYTQHTLNDPCPKSHRDRLKELDWISAGAMKILRSGMRKSERVKGDADTRLIVDHAVPIRVIHTFLFGRTGGWDAPDLTAFLTHHYRRGLLTKAEDVRLNAKIDGMSLNAHMPANWQIGDDPFARYRARHIEQADPGDMRA